MTRRLQHPDDHRPARTRHPHAIVVEPGIQLILFCCFADLNSEPRLRAAYHSSARLAMPTRLPDAHAFARLYSVDEAAAADRDTGPRARPGWGRCGVSVWGEPGSSRLSRVGPSTSAERSLPPAVRPRSSSSLVAEQTLDGVHAFTKNLVQR